MSAALLAPALTCAIFAILSGRGTTRRLALEFPTRGRRSAAFALLWLVLYAAVAVPVASSGEEIVVDLDRLSLLSLFTGHAILVAFLVAWWTLRRRIGLARFLHMEGIDRSDWSGGIRLGLTVWACTFGVAIFAGLILQLAVGPSGGAIDSSLEIPEIPEVMLWMVALPVYAKLAIVFVAMTVEEAFFRAFLQSRIGLLPSSVLFAFAHASYGLPTLMIGVFVVSLIIGRDFSRNGNLLRCMLAHGVFDAIQLLVVVPFAIDQLQQMRAIPG